jgi:hypothetical protein
LTREKKNETVRPKGLYQLLRGTGGVLEWCKVTRVLEKVSKIRAEWRSIISELRANSGCLGIEKR